MHSGNPSSRGDPVARVKCLAPSRCHPGGYFPANWQCTSSARRTKVVMVVVKQEKNALNPQTSSPFLPPLQNKQLKALSSNIRHLSPRLRSCVRNSSSRRGIFFLCFVNKVPKLQGLHQESVDAALAATALMVWGCRDAGMRGCSGIGRQGCRDESMKALEDTGVARMRG